MSRTPVASLTAPARLATLRSRLREQAGRVRRTLRVGRRPSERPLPRVGVRLGVQIPAVVLRLAVPAAALGCAALVVHGVAGWSVALLGALLLTLNPGGIVVACYAVAVGLALALAPAEPFAARSFLLLLGVHLLVQLAWLAAGLPWLAVVDIRVLVVPVRRFLGWQALAQLLALGAAAVSASGLRLAAAPVLVGVAVAGLAWWLLARLHHADADS